MPSPAGARFLVVGCGGIGGTIAATLLDQGLDVTLLTRNAAIRDAINSGGLQTTGELNLGTVRARAVTQLPQDTTAFDFVLLCTQPPQVEVAAREVLAQLADDGSMVVFQNGLCEPRIAAIAGAERVIGGVIAWGASMVAPGVYERTSAGGFTLGRIDGSMDDRLAQLGRILESVGPIQTTDNLMGSRWSKLAINCAISSLGTIGGDRLGSLLRKRYVRRLALEVMTETVRVASEEGVRLRKVAGTLDLDWIALTDHERTTKLGSAGLVAKHGLLLAVGARYRRLRSSMLNAIERGRPPAIDFLNGEVTARGKLHGIATPINSIIQEQVWAIARGEHQPGHDLLEAMFHRTRQRLRLPEESALETQPPPSS